MDGELCGRYRNKKNDEISEMKFLLSARQTEKHCHK